MPCQVVEAGVYGSELGRRNGKWGMGDLQMTVVVEVVVVEGGLGEGKRELVGFMWSSDCDQNSSPKSWLSWGGVKPAWTGVTRLGL